MRLRRPRLTVRRLMIAVALAGLGLGASVYASRLRSLKELYREEAFLCVSEVDIAQARAGQARYFLDYWAKMIEEARREEAQWAGKLEKSRREPAAPKSEQDDDAQVLAAVRKRIRYFEGQAHEQRSNLAAYTARHAYFAARQERYLRAERSPWSSLPPGPPEPADPSTDGHPGPPDPG